MHNEKKILISIFTIFFLLLIILFYLMIKNDIIDETTWEKEKEDLWNDNKETPQNWPKVEIKTRN